MGTKRRMADGLFIAIVLWSLFQPLLSIHVLWACGQYSMCHMILKALPETVAGETSDFQTVRKQHKGTYKSRSRGITTETSEPFKTIQQPVQERVTVSESQSKHQ